MTLKVDRFEGGPDSEKVLPQDKAAWPTALPFGPNDPAGAMLPELSLQIGLRFNPLVGGQYREITVL